jgi:hypothetical protein
MLMISYRSLRHTLSAYAEALPAIRLWHVICSVWIEAIDGFNPDIKN